jgi:hypothetical protein
MVRIGDMIDFVGHYKFAFFAPGAHLEPSPDIIARLLDTFRDKNLFPTTISEHQILPTPQTRLQLQMTTRQSELNLAFEPNRVLFSKLNVPGIEIGTVADFVAETVEVFARLLQVVPLTGTRLAYITKGLLPSMSSDALEQVNSRLLNLPTFYMEHPPCEWNTRNVARYEITLGDKVEIINVITHINRIQGSFKRIEKPQPFDRIEIGFDINTYQENKTARFKSSDVDVFLNQAVTISQRILDEMGGLFNV